MHDRRRTLHHLRRPAGPAGNLDLEQLAADKVHEFAFVFSPLRLKGASGSPGNPIAIR